MHSVIDTYSNCTQSKIPFYPNQNSIDIFNIKRNENFNTQLNEKMKNVCVRSSVGKKINKGTEHE